MKGWHLALLLLGLVLGDSASAARKHRNRHRNRIHRQPGNVSAPVATTDRDAIQRILFLEERRSSGDRYLLNAVFNPDTKTSLAAIKALGAIGDPAAIEGFSTLLNRKDPTRKKAAAFALSLIDDETARTILQQHVQMQKDPSVLAALYFSMALNGSERTVSTLSAAIQSVTYSEIQAAACRGLGVLWAGGSEKWDAPAELLQRLATLAQESDPVGSHCAFALGRYKGDPRLLVAVDVVDAFAKAKSPQAKIFLLRVLAKIRTPASNAILLQAAGAGSSSAMRLEATKALMTQLFSVSVQDSLKSSLGSNDIPLAAQALETISQHKTAAIPLAESIRQILDKSPSVWLRSLALKSLFLVDPVGTRVKLAEILKTPKHELTAAAVGALAQFPSEEEMSGIAQAILSGDTVIALEALQGLAQVPEEKLSPVLVTSFKKVLERGDPALSAAVATLASIHKWKDFTPYLVTGYPLFQSTDTIEAKIAALRAFRDIGDATCIPLLESATKDPEKLVVEAAVDSLLALTGKDERARIPLNSTRTPMRFTLSEAEGATRKTVEIQTTKGKFKISLFKETPLNALNFVRLVQKNFYQGLRFHRLVPGFVIQGGDPRGDGYGGPGYLMRDEFTSISQERGTVGMATIGKDTGGSQFYINLGPNYHLDGKYTVFGKVSQGMETVDKLEPGDKILSAKAL